MFVLAVSALLASTATTESARQSTLQPAARASTAAAPVEHKIYGFVQSLTGNTLVIRNRAGQAVVVDGRSTLSAVRFYRNRAVIVFGTVDAGGIVHARAVWRTFPDAAHWPADR